MSGSAIPTSQPTDACTTLARTAVVIVTYRSAATIRAALDSLPLDALAATIVVDNRSDDDTRSVVCTYDVTLVENATNAGFGAACNTAIACLNEHGIGPDVDNVLFLNPDATIDSENLAALITYLEDNPSCALVGPRLFRDGEPLTSAGRTSSTLTELRLVAPVVLARRLPDRRHPPAYDVTGPVGYVEGACFLVRRTALSEVGAFDPRYFLFYEELDLANRLRAADWTVDLCATASASHLVAQSRSSLEDNARGHLFDSAQRYLRRWHGAPAAIAFATLHRLTRARRGR